MPQKVPKLCRHRATGRAYVTDPFTGREVYLGMYGTLEADDAYRAWVRGFLDRQRTTGGLPARCDPTIRQLVQSYHQHAESYYRKQGQATTEVGTIKQVTAYLLRMFGSLPASDFGPAELKAVRQAMVDHGLARGHINKQVQRIRRLYRWAVEHELVKPEVLTQLQAVDALRIGRTTAREEEEVKPVDVAWVEATLRFLPPVLADMVRVQLLTAMRPGEVCVMRMADVDRSTEPWAYRPMVHKTQHFQKERICWLGPQARLILQGRYQGKPEAWLFPTPRHRTGEPGCYTRGSYRTAIQRIIRRYNVDCGPQLPSWHPLQLRHTAATLIRSRHGLDAAQIVLGHAEADVTQVYAARDAELARRVVEELG